MFSIYMKETNLNDIKSQFPWTHSNRKFYIENAQSVKLATLNGAYTNSNSNSNQRLVVYWQRKEDASLSTYFLIKKII